MAALLFDNNLSPRLPRALWSEYPESRHVRDVGLAKADDRLVWDFARSNGLAIVTKDDDFRQLAFVLGPPPKVIWVKLGNCATNDIIALLQSCRAAIASFLGDEAAALLVVGPRPATGRRDVTHG